MEPIARFHFDALRLLFHGFQICRHANPGTLTGRLPERLRFIQATLATVQHRDSFVIPVDTAAQDEIPRVLFLPDGASPEAKSLSPAQRAVLDFVQILLAELVRLAESGNLAAVRALGHQFHNLPSALRADRPYDRWPDSGLFQVAAGHWEALSSEMRNAFCQYAGVDLPEAERLMRRKGFADTSEY